MTESTDGRSKVRTIVAIAILTMVLLCAMATPATAKTYHEFSGHWVARYEQSDLDPSFRPFIDHIDYDLMSAPRMGVRLHFTDWGKIVIATHRESLAGPMACSIISAPEWSGDRSLRSVKWEIYQHAVWPNRMVVDIECYYADLKWWEKPYNQM